jgi:hypothetical protein
MEASLFAFQMLLASWSNTDVTYSIARILGNGDYYTIRAFNGFRSSTVTLGMCNVEACTSDAELTTLLRDRATEARDALLHAP